MLVIVQMLIWTLTLNLFYFTIIIRSTARLSPLEDISVVRAKVCSPGIWDVKQKASNPSWFLFFGP